MSFEKAIYIGLKGEQLSRVISGTSEVSACRSAVAAGTGAALGAASSGALVAGASALGVTAVAAAAAPLTMPVAVVSGVVALLASFWD